MVKQIENKFITVSEIAKIVGINRSTVWSYIRRNKIEPKEKRGNITYFDKNIVSKIEKKYRKPRSKTKIGQDNNSVSESVLKYFQEQIDRKDEQIRYLQSENIKLWHDNEEQKKQLKSVQAKLTAIPEEKKKVKKHWWCIFKN